MLPLQGFAHGDGFLQIVFHVVAVRAQDNQLTAPNQVLQGVRNPLRALQVGAHGLNGRQMVRIHAGNVVFWESPQKRAARSRCQQQLRIGCLHGAVVGQ